METMVPVTLTSYILQVIKTVGSNYTADWVQTFPLELL